MGSQLGSSTLVPAGVCATTLYRHKDGAVVASRRGGCGLLASCESAPQSDVCLLATSVDVNDGKRRPAAFLCRLYRDDVLVVLCARFELEYVSRVIALAAEFF